MLRALPTDPRRPISHRSHRLALPLLCGSLLAVAGSVQAQTWNNPGDGSWYDAVNWIPAFVPVAGDAVVVSNGGNALLDTVASGGATATPQLSSLSVGLAGSGTGRGGVSSTGVNLLAGLLNVGLASAGSFAEGRVVTTGAALSATVARIGVLFGQPGAASANGVVVVDGNYQAGGNVLEVAQMFNAAPGSVAQGRLAASTVSGTIGGGFWIVGNVTAGNVTQIGNRSQGEFVAGGGTLALASASTSFIGTTLGPDRVTDASGTRINEATGLVRLGGTLDVQQNGQGIMVGRTGAGRANGTLEAARIEMGANAFGLFEVGTAIDGDATGRLAVGGGTLRAASLWVGRVFGGGTASGEAVLAGTSLQAGNVVAGTGGGSADIALADSAAAIADDFVLGRGRLSLERSLLAVGDEFRLGADATLALMIEDENPGSGHGAVDALTAFLDGELQLDLTSYVFGSGSGVFDLVRAGVAGSIAGDFVSVVFSGLAVGWQAFTGIELVNGQQIYRLRLSTVPEPGSVALVVLALGLMGVAARQRSRRAGRGVTGRS